MNVCCCSENHQGKKNPEDLRVFRIILNLLDRNLTGFLAF